MEPIKFPGVTRVIGEAQGYIGLPLRDIWINDAVTGPDTPAMVSTWQPSEIERLAIANGRPITLCVSGQVHPPVMLSVEEAETAPEVASERHNRLAKDTVNRIVYETVGNGHPASEALVITESVLVGVSLALIRLGGDEKVLDSMFTAARQRLAEIRLAETKGTA